MPTSRFADLWVILGVAGTSLAILLFVDNSAMRTVFALPLLFFLPGNAVLAAAGPLRITGLERYVFSVGLSLAIVVLCGLGLHLLSAMTRTGWALSLSAIVAGGYALAARRSGDDSPTHWPWLLAWNLSFRGAAFAAATALLFGVAVYLADAGAQHREFYYTEFWMTPDSAGDDGTVNIGIKNVEAQPTTYDVELMLDARVVAAWRAIRLDEGESWLKTVDLPGPARSRRLEAWLFKSGNHASLYRRVWIAAKEPS